MSRRTPVQSKRPCDGCEKPFPPADLRYIWPLGRLCSRCRDQVANTPWVLAHRYKRERQ